MSNNYHQKAYIKDIYISIPDYEFNHHSLDGKEANKKYTGRDTLEADFLELLKKSGQRGAYLVSGFRGMGKTSFVKKVIKALQGDRKDKTRTNIIESISLSFAQKDIKEEDILKQLLSELIRKYESYPAIKIKKRFTFSNILSFSASILFLFIFLKIGFNFSEENILKVPSIIVIALGLVLIAKVTISSFNSIMKRITDVSFQNAIKKLWHWSSFIFIVLIILINLGINYTQLSALTGLSYLLYGLTFIRVIYVLFGTSIKKPFVLNNWRQYDTDVKVYSALKNLELSCNAQIVEEDGYDGEYTKELPFTFFQRKSKSYPISSAKQIENELIRVFKVIKEGNKLTKYKRSFIVVFDELDKVEPTIGDQIHQHDFQVLSSNKHQINKARDRKTAILSLLSSLKYFVCEADAKFIFIAGREMFDAALADIADRQSFISSIFHKVIYVDSFLKDNSKFTSSGLSATFEEYLSKILFGEQRQNSENEGSFLREYLSFLGTEQIIEKVSITPLLDEKARMKVIYTLQNFLIYLTYRSNGSPKKMSKLIEDQIISQTEEKINQKPFKNIIVRSPQTLEKTKTLWIRFSYHDQYRFGFISHLFRPYIFTFSEYAKRLSDNVLVSLPYLMDHILKFHHFAFSVQNLELLPEVISSTKNPTIRSFIAEIIDYLRLNHLDSTEIGLFDYRFLKKTSNEITYISKIFEAESAAFNFSLDEMFAIKQYLIGRIQFLKGKNSDLNTSTTDSYYSLSLLESLLGDSYYFDQEYDSAIVAYLDSLQSIKQNSVNNKRGNECFISSIRLTLKLGLMYELIKKYDMSLSYYQDAIDMFTKGNTKEKKTRISQVQTLYYQANLAALTLIEKGSIKGLTKETLDLYVNQVENELGIGAKSNSLLLADFYNDLGNIMFFNNKIHSTFRPYPKNVSTSSSVFLKKLINNKNIKSLEIKGSGKDFRVSTQVPLFLRKALIYALWGDNTERRFADVLKEASERITDYSNTSHSSELAVIGYNLSSIGNYLLSFYSRDGNSTNSDVDVLISWANEWESCNKWLKGLNVEIENCDNQKEFESQNLEELLKWRGGSLFNKEIKNKIKDVNTSKVNFPFVKEHFRELKVRPMKFWDIVTLEYFSNINRSKKSKPAELVFSLFYISGRYYSKSGVTKTFGYQLKKILHTFLHLRNEINLSTSKQINNKVSSDYQLISEFLEETVLSMILEAASWNSNSTDRGQVYKYKYYQKTEEENHGNRVFHPKDKMAENYLNASNSPDVKEGIILIAMIKLQYTPFHKLTLSSKEHQIFDFYKAIPQLNLVNEFNTLKTQYSRLVELSLLIRINKRIVESILFVMECNDWSKLGYKYYKKNETEKLTTYSCDSSIPLFSFLCEVVASSIFGLTQIIKIFKIYEIDPDLNNCQLAFHHKSLGVWLQIHALCVHLEATDETASKKMGKSTIMTDFIIDKKMNDFFESSYKMISLDATTQFQKALQYLHKAKGFHSSGLTFQSELNDIIYLEADYEDHYYQYGIALERQKMNSGKIRSLIRDLEKEIVDSPLFRYDSFVG